MVKSPLVVRIAEHFPHLKRQLKIAHIKKTPQDFVAKALRNGLTNGGGLTVLLVFLFIRKEWPIVFLPLIGVICITLFFYLDMVKIGAAISKRRKALDREVNFIGRYLLIKLYAGKPLLTSLIETSHSKGIAADYVKELVHDINTGTPLEEALKKGADLSPSPKFTKILFHLNNALKIGIDATKPLREVIEEFTKQDELEIRKYGKKLNTMVLVYMVAAIVMPSLGISMFIVLSNFISIPISLGGLLAITGLVMLLNLLFISLFRGIRPNIDL